MARPRRAMIESAVDRVTRAGDDRRSTQTSCVAADRCRRAMIEIAVKRVMFASPADAALAQQGQDGQP